MCGPVVTSNDLHVSSRYVGSWGAYYVWYFSSDLTDEGAAVAPRDRFAEVKLSTPLSVF
jgi:hypothetical protein